MTQREPATRDRGRPARRRISAATGTPVATAPEINKIIDNRLVSMVHQPVIELASGATVGFEALARGPAGSPSHGAEALFAAARAVGRVPELDWVCHDAALRAALDSGLPESLTWFINAEPTGYGASVPADLTPTIRAARRLRVAVEVTERDLDVAPGVLLRSVDRLRAFGWMIAVDDVGAHPYSLALLPVLGGDVVKLDLRLVQGHGRTASARVANAVRAYAERTGAVVIAEGIETERHRQAALVLGASHGQGYLWGPPGSLPHRLLEPDRMITAASVPAPLEQLSPFELVAARRPPRRTRAWSLVPMSRHLEQQALAAGESHLVLACFQHLKHFSAATASLYARLAARNAFTAAFAVGMADRPVPGVRGINLRPDDPLARQWIVIILGAYYAAALVARELGGPQREFDYAITHDQALVTAAARAMLARIGTDGAGWDGA